MTVSAAQLRALTALGITGDQLLAVVDVMEMRDERDVTMRDSRRDGPMTSAERSKNYRARQRDWNRDERDVTETVTPPPSPPPNGFPTPLPITTPSSPTLTLDAREPTENGWPRDGFEKFWKAYPHKVARKAASRAFAVAKRSGVTFDRLMFALERYVIEKPPDRAWCNPATWLNGGRWDDQPAGDGNAQRTSSHRSNTASGGRETGTDAILAGVAAASERRARQGGSGLLPPETQTTGFLDLEPERVRNG